MSSSRRLLILAVATCMGLLFASGFWAWYWLYRDTTTYAPGFTEEAFSTIEVGMTREEILALLGPPLSVDHTAVPERWLYESALVKPQEFAWKSEASVAFDGRGKVAGVDPALIGKLSAGMSKSQVLGLLGKPIDVIPARAAALSYSRPGGEAVFRGRIIELAADGRVIRIVKYQFHD